MTTEHAEHAGRRPRRHLFEDVSTVQVIATALAAVTSMLLSSYIGIAGSIIGVAVASVVSTLAASLYKRFLAESAEKIKELPVVSKTGAALSSVLPHHAEAEGNAGAKAADGADNAASSGQRAADQAADRGSEEGGSDRTMPLATVGDQAKALPVDEGEDPGATEALPAEDGEGLADGAPGAEEALAALHHQRRLVRGLVAVCIASALLAVAASGTVVYLATKGDGLGEKPAPIYLSAPFAPAEDSSAPSSASAAGSAASSGDGSSSAASSSSSSSSSSAGSSEEGEGGSGGDGEGGGQEPGPEPPAGEGDGGEGDLGSSGSEPEAPEASGTTS